jgi:hypothetical protein
VPEGGALLYPVPGARYRMSLIAAVTSRGHMRFTIKEKGRINAEFVQRLHVGSEKQDF